VKPRVSLITIGVDDLERALRFYRDGLGLKTGGIIGTPFEYGAVVFIDLERGLKLALWPRASTARDAGLPQGEKGPTEFTLGHNVASTPSGADMPATSRIPMAISGRSPGIPVSRMSTEPRRFVRPKWRDFRTGA